MLGFAETLISLGSDVIKRIVPDPEQQAKLQLEFTKAALEASTQQVELNKVEAASDNIFKSGWRPFIGWVCGCALAWQFVLVPLGTWALAIYGTTLPTPPSLDSMIWELMFGMLGMGGLRTIDKLKRK